MQKVLSLFLAFLLGLLLMLPAMAQTVDNAKLATEATTQKPEPPEETADELPEPGGEDAVVTPDNVATDGVTEVNAIQTGTAGPLTWTYDSAAKKMTISGSGAMPDYWMKQPWADLDIVILEVQNGCTRLGEGAFSHKNLTSVTLPNSLKELGAYAFWNCGQLRQITLPQNLEIIRDYAFYNCTALQSITVPYSTVNIGYGVFHGNSNLTITGYTGSPAWVYAQNSKIAFTSIGKHGWVTENGKRYFYQNNVLFKGWYNPTEPFYGETNSWYYLDPVTGAQRIGWVSYDGKWYYLSPDPTDSAYPESRQIGAMLRDRSLYLEGTYYRLDTNGAMVEGWWQDYSSWYYYIPGSGAQATEWQQIGDKWYYFGTSGYMQTGWQTIDGKEYYLTPVNGFMHTGWLQSPYGSKWNYFSPDSGAKVTGLVTIAGKLHYFDASGTWQGEVSGRNGWLRSGSRWYYFINDVRQSGWIWDGYAWYYMNPSMTTGWVKIGSRWYYMLPDSGKRAAGWQNIGGEWYFFESSGYMRTGWTYDNNYTYYLSDSGIMVKGWQFVDNRWRYFDPANGREQRSVWVLTSGRWYYVNWYGEMQTDWLTIENSKYYFNPEGGMVTGWKQLGFMWYYFGSSGKMATGWLQMGSTWYYLNPSNGVMVTGNAMIDGRLCRFSSSGVWLGYV